MRVGRNVKSEGSTINEILRGGGGVSQHPTTAGETAGGSRPAPGKA